MKNGILLLLVAVATTPCLGQPVPAPNLSYLGRTNSAPGKPLDSVLFCVTNLTYTNLVFTLRTTGTRALGDSNTYGSPIFIREKKVDGKWVALDSPPRWGQAAYVLPTGYSFTFAVPVPSEVKVWRVSTGDPPIMSKEITE